MTKIYFDHNGWSVMIERGVGEWDAFARNGEKTHDATVDPTDRSWPSFLTEDEVRALMIKDLDARDERDRRIAAGLNPYEN